MIASMNLLCSSLDQRPFWVVEGCLVLRCFLWERDMKNFLWGKEGGVIKGVMGVVFGVVVEVVLLECNGWGDVDILNIKKV